MATSKHIADAPLKINEYIDSLPKWSKTICNRLREIILKSDPKLVEDWKWGPNYYLQGMVCGFGAFQKHVNFVFFHGVLLQDPYKILQADPNTLRNKHIKFKDVKEINEDVILEYMIEAIDNNKKGKVKTIVKADKTVVVDPGIEKEFKAAGILNYFENMAYSHRKEYIIWISSAKKEETRKTRIVKAIEMMAAKETMHSKYKK